MQTFNLPSDDDGGDGRPESITHGADYMLSGAETLEYYYNFLNYHWVIDGEDVSARAYLDEIDDVSIFVTPEALETAAFGPVLRYLQRRFRTIKTFSQGEYRIQYQRAVR